LPPEKLIIKYRERFLEDARIERSCS